jgi:hypothetical protein
MQAPLAGQFRWEDCKDQTHTIAMFWRVRLLANVPFIRACDSEPEYKERQKKARTYIPPVNPPTALRAEHYKEESNELNKGALGMIVIDPLGKLSSKTTGTAYY